MKKVKIYITEGDAEDMASELRKGNTGLYDTWEPKIAETGETISLEIHLGDEHEQ